MNIFCAIVLAFLFFILYGTCAGLVGYAYSEKDRPMYLPYLASYDSFCVYLGGYRSSDDGFGVQAGGVFSTNHRKYGDEEYATNDERAGFLNTGDSKADQEFEQEMVRNYVSQYDDMVNRMNSETEDEFDAFRIAREIIKYLPQQNPSLIPKKVLSPRYSVEELNGIIPANPKISFDVRELLTRVIDDSDFAEFKKEYGKTMVTGWCKIHGYPIGIIANNGVIFSEAANKACQFIQLANRNNTPILFIHNTTGFIVGKKYEEGGIIKNGAKLINAVSNSEVPHLSLMIGSSFGAGNYAMNGRSYNPRFLFSYPNSKLGVMGSEQLAGVMEIIKNNAAKKKGVKLDKSKMDQEKRALIEMMSKKQTAWHSSSEMWDDGVIEPSETRNYLGFCLAVIYNQKIKGTGSFGVFRM